MALQALKTEEETALVPLDQPILVELPGGIDVPDDDKKDPAAKTLQEQLEALQAAQTASNERAERAERDAAQARREAQERAREAEEASRRASSLEGDIITGGLSQAQSELASAEAELERAGEAADYKAMAKAQARIGRASAQIVNLESGAAEVAEREKAPKPERQAAPDPIASIDLNPNLLPAEKKWLKDHPDSVIDLKRNNKLGVGYDMAIEKGLTRGTPDYFAFLEDFMGYTKANNEGDTTLAQAPVSRNERGSDGRPSGNKITLTSEQREVARSLGISDIDYAKQVMAFEAAQKNDPAKYGNR